MDNLELIKEARFWIRKGSEIFDDEIKQTIDAGILDLKNAGVKKTDIEDPLIKQALKLYLKSHFGYEKESEKFENSYTHLKISLSLSGDYNGGE